MTILCLGEAIADLVCERELGPGEEPDLFVPHPGGALANVAVAAAREGAEAALLGGVGADLWGDWLRGRLRRAGVGLDWLERVEEHATPVAFVTFDRHGEPAFQVYGEGIEATMLAGGRHLGSALGASEALILGSNTLVGKPERRLTMDAHHRALELGLPVLFDPNLRPNRWTDLDRAVQLCREACDSVFLVKTARREAELLTGLTDPAAAAEALCGLGARIAVVTTGAEGAVMRGAAEGQTGAPEAAVVSALGAGDAFMGALAAGLSRLGWEEGRAPEALEAAAAAGTGACGGWGAWR
ncbi:MAG TPA: PfkB family carbohydrate kinase [Solirubrobacterales bacterium]